MTEPNDSYFCTKCGTGAFCQPVKKQKQLSGNRKISIEKARTTTGSKRKEHATTTASTVDPAKTQKSRKKKPPYKSYECRKHPKTKKPVFCAEWYGNWLSSTDQFFLELCEDCNLSPCIAIDREKVAAAKFFATETKNHSKERVTKTYLRSETAIFLQKAQCKLLRQPYESEKKLPVCIRNFAETQLEDLPGFEGLVEDETS